jgi:hypothetical protein
LVGVKNKKNPQQKRKSNRQPFTELVFQRIKLVNCPFRLER